MKEADVSKIMGFVGAGLFNLLNITTNGAVPGGFKGGVFGAILGYLLTGVVFYILSLVKKNKK